MKMRSFYENSGPTGTVTIPCFTCAHCNRIVKVPKADEAHGFCMKCMYHTCVQCGGADRCTPFEAKIEAYEKKMAARARFLESLG